MQYELSAMKPLKRGVRYSIIWWKQWRAITKGLPSIIISTTPKSGTVYIWETLARALRMPILYISVGRFYDDRIVPQWFEDFACGGAVTVTHLPADRENLMFLHYAGIKKVLVHVRDPRQAILSLIHHNEEELKNEKEMVWVASVSNLPLNWAEFEFHEKIDWHIKNTLPRYIDWLDKWIEVEKKREFNFEVCYTFFDELKSTPEELFKKIYDFYGIDTRYLPEIKKPEVGKLHFRKGEKDEWRRVFSPEQIKAATNTIPARFFKRFDWQR